MTLSLETILTTSLGMIGSLAWNEFFKNSINKYSNMREEEEEGENGKGKGKVMANFIYAVVITILILVIYKIYKKTVEAAEKAKLIEKEKEEIVIELGLDAKSLSKLNNIDMNYKKEDKSNAKRKIIKLGLGPKIIDTINNNIDLLDNNARLNRMKIY